MRKEAEGQGGGEKREPCEISVYCTYFGGKCLLLEAVSRDRVEKEEEANQVSFIISRKPGKKGYQQGPMLQGVGGACDLR